MSSADDVYMAKLAEQAERYDEMVEYMKKIGPAREPSAYPRASPATSGCKLKAMAATG